ncbi:MAG: hypothetical protein DRI34_09400 [Deltaproteobacteria bacterium]|nr:MAG: hypothetical protein DRI34_09400 [Deltaproteobacteria bacterium]
MKNPFHKWSIRWKMAAGFSLVLFLSVTVLLTYFIGKQRHALKSGLEARVTTVANMLSWSLVILVDAAAVTGDVKPIEEVIESARQDSQLVGIRVENASGTRLAGFDDKALTGTDTNSHFKTTRFTDDLLLLNMPIRKDDNNIGVLRMGYSLAGLHSEQRQLLLTGLGIGLVTLLAGILLAFAIGHRISRPLVRMTSTFKRMAEGDLNQQPVRESGADEIGFLARAFNELLQQLKDLSQLAQAISQGDLTHTIKTKGDLADAFRRMTASIVEITSSFNQMAARMDSRISEILTTAKEQEAGAAQQAAAVTEVTSTMEELAATARQISQNAESVTSSAEEASRAVTDGREALFAFVKSMNSIETGNKTISDNIVGLNRHVQQIRGIIDIINDIADRSDLLALNAALEGTKAGEAGKGFLLVAAEMRRLSENVFNSTAEIKQLITEVTEATNATVMANESGLRATQEGTERAAEAEQAFGRIVETIEETSRAAKQISLATQQQHTGTDQIVSAMGEVANVSQQWLNGIRSTTQAVSELSTTAAQLRQLVSRYRLGSE